MLDSINNAVILDLLFELATWHGLAKLRLHTESTVRALESSTTRLGIALRKFQSTTCAAFVTRDLPSEEAARGRRKAAKVKKPKATTKKPDLKGKKTAVPTDSKLRAFNLSTYKTHALGYYPKTIRELGTTDGYSTQNVSFHFSKYSFPLQFLHLFIETQGELEHRRCKRFYPRVHKGLFALGIAREVRRERILHFKETNPPHKKQKKNSRKSISVAFTQSENLPPANPNQRYQMSNETRHPHDISKMLGDFSGDPACNVSYYLIL